jgi:hypothetical protein
MLLVSFLLFWGLRLPESGSDPRQEADPKHCSTRSVMDTESGAFLTLDPGSGIDFFLIPDLDPRDPEIR